MYCRSVANVIHYSHENLDGTLARNSGRRDRSGVRERRRSKSDIVRERLSVGRKTPPRGALPEIIADVVGAVDDLPVDMSERVKDYLKIKGYGRKRPR